MFSVVLKELIFIYILFGKFAGDKHLPMAKGRCNWLLTNAHVSVKLENEF